MNDDRERDAGRDRAEPTTPDRRETSADRATNTGASRDAEFRTPGELPYLTDRERRERWPLG